MQFTGYEYNLYSDFNQAIIECAAEYSVKPSENLVLWIMTRVNQDIVHLYEKWGVNDTEFTNALQKVVAEALIMKGYHKEVLGKTNPLFGGNHVQRN